MKFKKVFIFFMILFSCISIKISAQNFIPENYPYDANIYPMDRLRKDKETGQFYYLGNFLNDVKNAIRNNDKENLDGLLNVIFISKIIPYEDINFEKYNIKEIITAIKKKTKLHDFSKIIYDDRGVSLFIFFTPITNVTYTYSLEFKIIVHNTEKGQLIDTNYLKFAEHYKGKTINMIFGEAAFNAIISDEDVKYYLDEEHTYNNSPQTLEDKVNKFNEYIMEDITVDLKIKQLNK